MLYWLATTAGRWSLDLWTFTRFHLLSRFDRRRRECAGWILMRWFVDDWVGSKVERVIGRGNGKRSLSGRKVARLVSGRDGWENEPRCLVTWAVHSSDRGKREQEIQGSHDRDKMTLRWPSRGTSAWSYYFRNTSIRSESQRSVTSSASRM